MNLKKLSLSLGIFCINVLLCFAEADLPVRDAFSQVMSDGNAQFTILEGKVGIRQYIQLSKFSDFSVIDGFGFKKPSSIPATLTMNKGKRVYGTYYWRIYDEGEGKYYYGNDRTITYGEKEPDVYVPVEDPTEYENVTLDDGRQLELKSVWFRSVNTENRIARMVDFPHDSNNDISADIFTPNQSCVVKNNIIYIARGNSGNISGWVTDKSRVWLARYDLLTGEELPMLWVRSPDPNGFAVDDWRVSTVMNWIHEDADGTPYFVVILTNPARPGRIMANIYTLNLSNLDVETESVTPSLALSFEYSRTDEEDKLVARHPMDMTIEGSIKSRNYKLWAVEYNHNSGMQVNGGGSGNMPVWRWNVTSSGIERVVSHINYLSSLAPGEWEIDEFYGHLTPVGNDYFYFHSAAVQKDDTWISPMLYRFVPNGVCETVGHFGNCRDIVTSVFPMPAGVSVFKIENLQLVAYGQGIDEKRGTGIQLVSTPSVTDDFSGHKKMWLLGGETGLAKHRVQSSQVLYIPDEPSSTGGRILMYAANAGIGLYRVNILSETVGVESVRETMPEVRYVDGKIVFSRIVDGFSLYSLTGQVVVAHGSACDSYAVGDLAPGCYILSIPSSPAPVKIIVK